LTEDGLFGRVSWGRTDLVGHDVGKGSVVLVAERLLERDWHPGSPERLLDAIGADAHLLADLFGGGAAAELMLQLARDVVQLGQLLHDVDRQADRAALLGYGPTHGLPNPPV